MRKKHYDQIMELAKLNTKYYVDGKSLREISNETGLSYETLLGRWKRGIRDYESLTSDEGLKNDEYRLNVACARGRRFLETAIRKGITMSEVSKRTGISPNTIWSFICNDTDISSYRLTALCDCVGVSMDYVSGLKRVEDGKEEVCG